MSRRPKRRQRLGDHPLCHLLISDVAGQSDRVPAAVAIWLTRVSNRSALRATATTVAPAAASASAPAAPIPDDAPLPAQSFL